MEVLRTLPGVLPGAPDSANAVVVGATRDGGNSGPVSELGGAEPRHLDEVVLRALADDLRSGGSSTTAGEPSPTVGSGTNVASTQGGDDPTVVGEEVSRSQWPAYTDHNHQCRATPCWHPAHFLAREPAIPAVPRNGASRYIRQIDEHDGGSMTPAYSVEGDPIMLREAPGVDLNIAGRLNFPPRGFALMAPEVVGRIARAMFGDRAGEEDDEAVLCNDDPATVTQVSLELLFAYLLSFSVIVSCTMSSRPLALSRSRFSNLVLFGLDLLSLICSHL